MQYTLMFYLGPDEFAARTDPDKKEAFWAAFLPYLQAIKDAGIFVGGAGLQPPDAATTVRLRDGQRLVQDGPFGDSKEQLGGFTIIEVPDLDTALDWAARYPAGPDGSVPAEHAGLACVETRRAERSNGRRATPTDG